MGAESSSGRESEHCALLRRAATASRRMRLAGSVVFILATITSVAVAVSWITGFYPWEVAVPILFATITGGVLTGTVARAQSYGIDINAARFEIALSPEPAPPAQRPRSGSRESPDAR